MGDEPVPTEKDVHDIRTLDWLAHEVNCERDRRKAADWARRQKIDPRDREARHDKSGQFDRVPYVQVGSPKA